MVIDFVLVYGNKLAVVHGFSRFVVIGYSPCYFIVPHLSQFVKSLVIGYLISFFVVIAEIVTVLTCIPFPLFGKRAFSGNSFPFFIYIATCYVSLSVPLVVNHRDCRF